MFFHEMRLCVCVCWSVGTTIIDMDFDVFKINKTGVVK